MNISYTVGPRFIDGINIDFSVEASVPCELEVEISEPVTGLLGIGYEPGQKNRDGGEL